MEVTNQGNKLTNEAALNRNSDSCRRKSFSNQLKQMDISTYPLLLIISKRYTKHSQAKEEWWCIGEQLQARPDFSFGSCHKRREKERETIWGNGGDRIPRWSGYWRQQHESEREGGEGVRVRRFSSQSMTKSGSGSLSLREKWEMEQIINGLPFYPVDNKLNFPCLP